ncbi:hypothetical protein ABH924_003951 [Arthrobacter sp. GAS37]|uniref:hypothetical protein n=1 Tax=Arthrobacter sp. GAS37 TaxID=3156261 RepID=UPI0038339D80
MRELADAWLSMLIDTSANAGMKRVFNAGRLPTLLGSFLCSSTFGHDTLAMLGWGRTVDAAG